MQNGSTSSSGRHYASPQTLLCFGSRNTEKDNPDGQTTGRTMSMSSWARKSRSLKTRIIRGRICMYAFSMSSAPQ